MSTSASRSAEEVFYSRLKYIPVDPLEHNVHCLDVVTKADKSWVQRLKAKFSFKLPPFIIQGSMLDVKLMREDSNWRSGDQVDVNRMRKGLADLENLLKPRPSHQSFQKKKLPNLNLSFSTTKKGVLWLASVAGIDLGKEESLSCTMEGLTAASVDYLKICDWIIAGDWNPNLPILQMISSDGLRQTGKGKKLWIVTEVLYATKLTVTGRRGLFDKAMAHVAAAPAPGVTVDVGADIGIQFSKETTLELKAKRNKQFIVGYRTMRVEYDPDGKAVLLRKAEDGGLRGDDDDQFATMEEDIFEADEDGGKALVPLLTLTEEDLHTLQSHVEPNCGDSGGMISSEATA